MTEFLSLLPPPEALNQLLAQLDIQPTPETISIEEALGRVNSQDIADKFIDENACRMVADGNELVAVVSGLFDDPNGTDKLGRNARELLEQNRGALQRLLVLLEPLLDE